MVLDLIVRIATHLDMQALVIAIMLAVLMLIQKGMSTIKARQTYTQNYTNHTD